MRLVRIDRLAPGGAPLQLHPRLTVVTGAPPEMRRRLLQAVRAIVGGEDPECGGTIEVSGVRLALDRSTLDQLRLDHRIDPVVTFPVGPTGQARSERPTEPQRSEPLRTSTPDPAPPERPPNPWVTSTVVAGRSRDDLRSELRSVTDERTRLGERMEQTRRGLDSFSRAALDVCRGQIEALESRRSSLRAEWDAHRRAHTARRSELLRTLADQRASLESIGQFDATAIRESREALAALLDVPDGPDREAHELADRLESALAAAVAEGRRHADQDERVAAAEGELLDAREALTAAEGEVHSSGVDPSVVRRLEEVRDEIFSEDDRSGLLGTGRGKRRVQELRAEEAVLLDQLGFDTYSAYVMGIPSVRADLERSDRLVDARDRVARAEEELGAARAAGSGPAPTRGRDQLVGLLADARALLGARTGQPPVAPRFPSPTPFPSPTTFPSPGPTTTSAPGDDLPAEVGRIVSELRRLRSGPPRPDDPRLRGSMQALVTALRDAEDRAGSPSPAPVPMEPTPQDLLDLAERWVVVARERSAAAGEIAAQVRTVEAQLAELDAQPEPQWDLRQLAHVEAELDSALDRLAEAEDRVRSHEEAMDRLADLRAEELVLRERERELLAAIAEVDDARSSAAAADAGDPPTPPPYHGPQGAEGSGTDLHWLLISRLAEQRAVSFAGSVPMVLDGLPEDRRERDEVLERVEAMSDLVQMVVLSDAPEVLDRVSRLGTDASVHRV